MERDGCGAASSLMKRQGGGKRHDKIGESESTILVIGPNDFSEGGMEHDGGSLNRICRREAIQAKRGHL